MTNYIDRPALKPPAARTPSAPSEATHEWSNEPKSATNSSNAHTTEVLHPNFPKIQIERAVA